jgi:hypothetical protein
VEIVIVRGSVLTLCSDSGCEQEERGNCDAKLTIASGRRELTSGASESAVFAAYAEVIP